MSQTGVVRGWPLAAIILLALGCATSPVERAKQVALISKESAEGAYLTVRTLYLRGRVDEETMRQARELYTAWAFAQEALVEEIRAVENGGSPDRLVLLEKQTRRAARTLAALARRLEGRPTTRSAR